MIFRFETCPKSNSNHMKGITTLLWISSFILILLGCQPSANSENEENIGVSEFPEIGTLEEVGLDSMKIQNALIIGMNTPVLN